MALGAEQPLISVILPVYNVEKLVTRAVESLIAQTWSNMEIILVDDGSLDKSGEICDTLAGKYQNVRVIHQANMGVSAARNAGLNVIQGEYFGFIDPDDFVEPDMYEFLYTALIQGKADISCCAFDNYYADSIDSYQGGKRFHDVIVADQALWREMEQGILITCNKLFKYSICGDLRYNISYINGEDRLFAVHAILRASRVAYSLEDKYHYFHRTESAGTKRFTPKDYTLVDCCREICVLCQNLGGKVENRANQMLASAYIQLLSMSGIDKYPEYVQVLQKGLKTCYESKNICQSCSKKQLLKYKLAIISPMLFVAVRRIYIMLFGKKRQLIDM